MAAGKKNFPLSVTIKAIDKLTAPMRKMQGRIDRTLGPLKKIQGRLKLLRKTSGFDRILSSFKGMGTALMGVGRAAAGLVAKLGLVAGAAAAAGFALIRAFASEGDRLTKLSTRLKISVESIQELEYAAESAGVEQKMLEMGLQNLTIRAGETAQGFGQAKGAFDALGVSVRRGDGKLKDSGTLMHELADALSGLKDEQLQLALASKIFGTRQAKLVQMFPAGAQGLRDYAAALRESGAVISTETAKSGEDVTQALTDMTMAFRGIQNVIMKHVLEPFRAFIDRITEWLKMNREQIAEWVDQFMKDLPERLQRLRKRLDDLWESAKPAIEKIKKLGEELKWLRVLAIGVGLAVGLAAKVLLGPLVASLAAATAAILKFTIAMLASPLGPWIIGIGALVGLGYVLWDNWDSITDWLADKFGWLGDIWDATFGKIAEGIGWVVDQVSSVFGSDEAPTVKVERAMPKAGGARRAAPDVFSDAELSQIAGQAGGASVGDLGLLIQELKSELAGAGGKSRVEVAFENAPPGMRAKMDPGSDLPTDLTTGMTLAPGF